jgi:hypothetical protein
MWKISSAGLFLIVIGAVAAVAGFHDATLRDASFGINVLGWTFLVGGLVMVFGGAFILLALAGRLQIVLWRGRVALAACLVAIGIGAYFVLAEARSFTHSGALIGLGALVAGFGLFSFVTIERTTKVTLGKMGVFLAGLAGLAFTVFQYWYANQYIPAAAPPALTTTAKLEQLGIRGGLVAYRATITTKNAGTAKVVALASTYAVTGWTVTPRRSSGDAEEVAAPFEVQAPDPQISRFSLETHETAPELVQVGRLFSDGRSFEPSEEATREYVVYVPEDTYDLLRVRAHVVVAKGGRLRLSDEATFRPELVDDVVVAQWALKDDSWIRDLIDGEENSILVNYRLRRAGVDASAWLAPKLFADSERIKAYTDQAKGRIGLADSFAASELAVVDAETPVTTDPK